MNATTDLHKQLRSLSIEKHQRPRGAAAPAKSRIGLLVVLLLLTAAGGTAYAYRERLLPAVSQVVSDATQKVAEVPTVTVRVQTDSSAPPTLTATGKIVSDHTVEVATKVSGQIVEILFEQGDEVKAGQLLARLEDVNYRARRDEGLAMVAKARANYDYYKYNFERISRLHSGTDASDIELVDARRWYEDAKAALAADEARLEFAEKLLRDCEVRAPIGGVILERNVEVGDFVAAEGGRGANANAQFASIADMSKLRVEVDVSELDIARLRDGMRCVITPDAYKDRRYEGHLMWIDPGANYAKATVQVKVRIEQPDAFLRVQGSAQVQFSTDASAPTTQTRAIWIPVAAVANEAEQTYVFRVREGKLVRTPIQTGRSVSGQLEVLSGLGDGDVIAASGVTDLQDGQRVK